MKLTKEEIKKNVGETTLIERWEKFSEMYDWCDGNIIQATPENFDFVVQIGFVHEECETYSKDDKFRFGRSNIGFEKRVVFCL